MNNIDLDILEMYKLAAKKTKESGYPLTKDRIWDQYVSISFRAGMKQLLRPHKKEPYFEELKRLGIAIIICTDPRKK